MIRLRFVWGYDPLSALIRAGERDGDCPTHVDNIMPEGTMLGAHLDGGVQIRPPGYDAAPTMRDLVVLVPWASDIQQSAWEAFLLAQVGKPYDATAIAGVALNRDWREPDSWMCSELAAAALEQSGWLSRLSTQDNHVSPRDLLMVLSGRLPIITPAPALPDKETAT